MMKICLICKESKDSTYFKRKGWCISCAQKYAANWRKKNREKCREYDQRSHLKRTPEERELKRQVARNLHLIRQYGITLDEYNKILASQDGVCNICQKPGRTGRWDKLVVDHDHETKKVRGLLCSGCNVAIAALGDGVSGIERALRHVRNGLK